MVRRGKVPTQQLTSGSLYPEKRVPHLPCPAVALLLINTQEAPGELSEPGK